MASVIAATALALGILAVIPLLGYLFIDPAVAVSIVAVVRCQEEGRRMARAALALSVAGIVVNLLVAYYGVYSPS
jgi:hypothetical protein